jgi:3-oxoacyl-[acyl-carrier protein] reductase
MNISLSGKYAVICGSTQGIGLAIAQELALLGAHCTLIARNEDALIAAVSTLQCADNQQHGYLVADFSQSEQVKNTIHQHVEKYPVHILVNNTGGPPAGPIVSADPAIFLQYFEQHVVCNQILSQACIPSMKAAGYGRIINIISTSVKVPLNNLGVSNTIRGAVASWSKTLANEIGQFGITVNNILPGFTKTQRLSSLIDTIAAGKNTSAAIVSDNMEAEVPAKRFGTAQEIANVAVFLATPAAAYVNGTNIPVDGGRTGSM